MFSDILLVDAIPMGRDLKESHFACGLVFSRSRNFAYGLTIRLTCHHSDRLGLEHVMAFF